MIESMIVQGKFAGDGKKIDVSFSPENISRLDKKSLNPLEPVEDPEGKKQREKAARAAKRAAAQKITITRTSSAPKADDCQVCHAGESDDEPGENVRVPDMRKTAKR